MALGKILRDAREARGMSTTDVAEHTNMMVQIVTDLENEDFHRIAAPIYGRGFLKLYAELLDLEVQPLIDEFMDIYTGNAIPAVQRREHVPDEVKKPVPVETPAAKPEQSEAPRRIEVIPRQAARIVDTAPESASIQEDQSEKPPAEQKPMTEVSTPPPAPVVSSTPAKEPQRAVVDAEPQSPVERMEKAAQPTPPPPAAPPEPSDDLFDADEPNLFNTSPLHERIAEARRLMDEKEAVLKEEKKVASLHIGANQRLPVFQIGGRMEKTYGTKSGSSDSTHRHNLLGSMFRAIAAFFRRFRFELPAGLKNSQRKIFVVGALGVIVLVFLISGVRLIFKLTKQPSDGANKAVVAAAIAQKVTKPVQAASSVKDEIPAPPDMYFD